MHACYKTRGTRQAASAPEPAPLLLLLATAARSEGLGDSSDVRDVCLPPYKSKLVCSAYARPNTPQPAAKVVEQNTSARLFRLAARCTARCAPLRVCEGKADASVPCTPQNACQRATRDAVPKAHLAAERPIGGHDASELVAARFSAGVRVRSFDAAQVRSANLRRSSGTLSAELAS